MVINNGSEVYDHHRGKVPLLRRTGRKRFWTFFAINFTGFIVVSTFWQYLCTGGWGNFRVPAYLRDLTTPLGEMLFRPLNIFTHPWMIVVSGLLLGLVILVPVIVAVLYRLLLAGLFVAAVAIVGHAPVLAVVVGIGCVLAARTPLRSDMPFLAVFLGLAPVALYLFLFGFAGADIATVLPLKRWILRVPFFVALVSAVLSGAVVLALARATGFRPGVVWPVLAVLLVAPMLIFFLKIGPAELDYALITGRLAPGGAILQPVSLEDWSRRNAAAGLNEQALQNRVDDDLKLRQRTLINICEEFLEKYSDSKEAPSVLWIQARCLSLQFDREAFRNGRLVYTDFYPLEVSASVWERLRDRYSASGEAALGNWRLAQLALRRKEVEKADTLLHQAAERLNRLVSTELGPRPAVPAGEVFSEPVALPGTSHYVEARFQVERLIWVIEQNDLLGDDRSAEAMAEYLTINPCSVTDEERYRRLTALATKYEDTKMFPNLKLAVALAAGDVDQRVNQLLALAGQWSDSDAAIEANYQLAQLVLRRPVLQLKRDMEKPQVYFKRVKDAPPSPWRRRAGQRLEWLRTSPTPKE